MAERGCRGADMLLPLRGPSLQKAPAAEGGGLQNGAVDGIGRRPNSGYGGGVRRPRPYDPETSPSLLFTLIWICTTHIDFALRQTKYFIYKNEEYVVSCREITSSPLSELCSLRYPCQKREHFNHRDADGTITTTATADGTTASGDGAPTTTTSDGTPATGDSAFATAAAASGTPVVPGVVDHAAGQGCGASGFPPRSRFVHSQREGTTYLARYHAAAL